MDIVTSVAKEKIHNSQDNINRYNASGSSDFKLHTKKTLTGIYEQKQSTFHHRHHRTLERLFIVVFASVNSVTILVIRKKHSTKRILCIHAYTDLKACTYMNAYLKPNKNVVFFRELTQMIFTLLIICKEPLIHK